MAHVHDVASYILNKEGPMTTMKLQKLVYYSQAWSLVWDEKPLFFERIEAWASGPVVPALFQRHRRVYMVDEWPWGEHEKLTLVEKASIDAVLDYYGNKWLCSQALLRCSEKGAISIADAIFFSSILTRH